MQNKLNRRHAKWAEFIEYFPYIIKYKRKERIMLLLMLCLDDILCCPNLIVVFLDLKQLKSNM